MQITLKLNYQLSELKEGAQDPHFCSFEIMVYLSDLKFKLYQGRANSADPYQTAHRAAVRTESTLFASLSALPFGKGKCSWLKGQSQKMLRVPECV